MKNASNTYSNTDSSTHYLWLVEIHMSPTKSCRSPINLLGDMWILTHQKKYVEKCVLKYMLLAFFFGRYSQSTWSWIWSFRAPFIYSFLENHIYQDLPIRMEKKKKWNNPCVRIGKFEHEWEWCLIIIEVGKEAPTKFN